MRETMPARNIYHDLVAGLLIAEGWTITDDPLTLSIGDRNLYVDLGVERNELGAERNGERIAVEIQSFTSNSVVDDLQGAIGQYVLYRSVLSRQQPDRPLFLAIPKKVYDGILSEPLGQAVMVDLNFRLLVFDPEANEVVRWIS
jgi:hypothetical protein